MLRVASQRRGAQNEQLRRSRDSAGAMV